MHRMQMLEMLARAITLHGGECVASLRMAAAARPRLSVSTGHYAQSGGSAAVRSLPLSVYVFTGKVGSRAVSGPANTSPGLS